MSTRSAQRGLYSMSPNIATLPNVHTVVIPSDEKQHIEDMFTVNAIRDGKLVPVAWADLTPEERRRALDNLFHYNGC